jgi:hypothetical protein
MIARNDAPNDRLQPDLQSVVALDSFDFSWVKPREQDFCITRSGVAFAQAQVLRTATKGGRARGVRSRRY